MTLTSAGACWSMPLPEIAPLDRELGRHIAACLDELQSFFRRCLVRAQADGSVPADRDPAEIAALLLGVVMGIRVLARAKPDRKLLKRIAKPALALLD